MKSFYVIVQTTLACNMRCKHCYEEGQNNNAFVMSESTLENLIKKLQKEFDSVRYLWFGGEPLLAGLDFFKKAIYFQNKYKRKNTTIENSIQTNGLLLNDSFLNFFKENDFKVSVSYDGPSDAFVRDSGDIVFKRIIKAKGFFPGIGILSTIHKYNFTKQIEMYNFFRDGEFNFKFNRIFLTKNHNSKDWLIDNKEYLEYQKEFFMYWLHDKKGVLFSPFSDYVRLILNHKTRSCENTGCLYRWLSVSPSGDIFPCTRIFDDEYNVGNINDVNLITEVFDTQKYQQIVKKSIVRRKQCLSDCELYYYCNGGCNAMSINETSLDKSGTQYCEFNKGFIPFVKKTIEDLQNNINEYDDINPGVLALINKAK